MALLRANEILNFLGIVAGGVSTSVLAYLKWKKNRKPTREEERPDGTVVLVVDLRARTFFTPQGGVKTEYEILNVHRRLNPPKQHDLFLEE